MPIAVIYIIVFALFLGAAPLPYGYYTILRIMVTGFFIWAAVLTYQQKEQILPWVFVVLAITFNPIIKVYLSKELWAVIDILVGIFVITISSRIRENKHRERDL